jgi:hypothetical protein
VAGELLIQVIDIGRFQAIRSTLDALEASRALSPEFRAVLREAAASPFACKELNRRFARVIERILRQPQLELRMFLAPGDLDEVIQGVLWALCFKDGGEFSLSSPVGRSWVVIDHEFPAFMELDWFRATLLNCPGSGRLPYPRRAEARYHFLAREDVVRVAAGVRRLLENPGTGTEPRSTAEGLLRLASEALSSEDLTLTYLSLL